ncbi:MAG: membrane protease YdiL (CAAX protease family) [Pirellulaceae bacterium]|jgi:membrane protease YdiL (CAAX protease family)
MSPFNEKPQDNENPFPLNPYDPPREDSSTEKPAEPVRITFFSSPQPNMLMAFIWTLGLMFFQVVVGGVFGIGLLLISAFAFRESISPGGLPPWITNILIPVGTLTTLAAAVAVCALYYRGQTKRRIAWRFCSMTQLFLVALSVVPLATVASEVVNWAGEYLPNLNGAVFASFSQQPFLLVFIAACVLPGLGEEIFFRGFVHHGLSKRYGMIPTILVTSLLFGFMHVDPVQSCGAAFLGMWLHYLVWHTKSLAAPIILHVLNNTLAFVSMKFADFFPIPGVTYTEVGRTTHTPLLLLSAAVAAGIPLGLAIWQCRTYWVLPDGKRWESGIDEPDVPDESLEAVASYDGVSITTWLAIAATYASFIAAMVIASQSV